MTSLPREPLLHFLLIGAALFLLHGWKGVPAPAPRGQAGPPAARIVVTPDDVRQMADVFTKTWQRPPTAEEGERLIEDFVRTEIYYREAIAIGLDRDDQVLRRRLRQKMEFIYEDISSWAEPTDDELQRYLATHRERYLGDPQIAFRHVYLSTYTRGAAAESDAHELLTRLANGLDPDSVGDPTLLEPEISLSPLWDIRKQFGDEFARGLLPLSAGRWAGPIRSGFGLHLVLVKERRDGRLPPLDEVRESVKRDWMAEQQAALKDAAYAKLRERYLVIVERPPAAAARATAAAR